MLCHAAEHGWQLRFIEQMPIDAQGSWTLDRMDIAQQIHELWERDFAQPFGKPRLLWKSPLSMADQ